MKLRDFFYFSATKQSKSVVSAENHYKYGHRHLISVTDIFYQNKGDFSQHLSMRFEFVRKLRLQCL